MEADLLRIPTTERYTDGKLRLILLNFFDDLLKNGLPVRVPTMFIAGVQMHDGNPYLGTGQYVLYNFIYFDGGQ